MEEPSPEHVVLGMAWFACLTLSLFGRRNFTAAITVVFLLGFAMFGAVTFLPQFQQNAQAASATSSGLLLPLMGGMLDTSLASGQLITRTGRYEATTVLSVRGQGRRLVRLLP